jgi:nicotinamidase-related amidase
MSSIFQIRKGRTSTIDAAIFFAANGLQVESFVLSAFNPKRTFIGRKCLNLGSSPQAQWLRQSVGLRGSLIANINELVTATREAETPLVWVKQEFSPDLSDAPLEVKRGNISIVISGTSGAQILPELDVRSSDNIIIKKRYSAFFGTDLDHLLRSFHCDTLIVAGVNTHACIRATVVDAYQRYCEVILARECIESHDGEHHDMSLRYMDGKLGRGMDNREIRSLLVVRPS